MTKKRFHTSLQLKLTLLLSLLMIISCVLMYFFISHSAVSGMDGLQNYMIKVDPQDGDSPITFNAVSYTHLDVYKRQATMVDPTGVPPRMETIIPKNAHNTDKIAEQIITALNRL